ncbi:MAG: hypothetical protein ABL986_16825 [Vicinamibacterales bacterium]
MLTIEERVAYVEGQVSDHQNVFQDIRESIRHLEYRMDAGFATVDRRFEAIDRRFEGVDHRLEALDQKVSRHFMWLVGMQMTTLIAVVGALLSRG